MVHGPAVANLWSIGIFLRSRYFPSNFIDLRLRQYNRINIGTVKTIRLVVYAIKICNKKCHVVTTITCQKRRVIKKEHCVKCE